MSALPNDSGSLAANAADQQETREWMDALSAVIQAEGPERAHQLLEELLEHARENSIDMPFSATTGYVNSIEPDHEAICPGNIEIEERLRAYGHNPANFNKGTLRMVHVAETREQAWRNAAEHVHEILSTPREDADDASRLPLEDVNGEVRFEDVWFEYNPGVPVLKGVTFTAPADTVVKGSTPPTPPCG